MVNPTDAAKPRTIPLGSIPVASGGFLTPFRKGDASARHLQVAGGKAGSKLNKRPARLLRSTTVAYGARPKVIIALLETLRDRGKYKNFLATEFAELIALSDGIFEEKLRQTVYKDAEGKWHRQYTAEERQGALELKMRMLELSLKLANVFHPELDHKRSPMQAVQVVVGDKTLEIRPLSAPLDASYSSPEPSESSIGAVPASGSSPEGGAHERSPVSEKGPVDALKQDKTKGDSCGETKE